LPGCSPQLLRADHHHLITVAIVHSAKVCPNPIIAVLPAVAIAVVFISEVAAEALLVAIARTP